VYGASPWKGHLDISPDSNDSRDLGKCVKTSVNHFTPTDLYGTFLAKETATPF